MPIRLVIADDHTVVLKGLATFLGLEPDLEILATCTNGDDAVEAVRRHRPDILLLDLRMPVVDGLAVLRTLSTEPSPPRVVLLTATIEDDEVVEAVRLGAAGVFLKELPPELLLECIRKVHEGERWLEKHTAARALDRVVRQEKNQRAMAGLLTPREIEIIRMVAEGMRTGAVAKRLNVAEGTVKTHLHNIYDKLKIDGRVALTLFAIQNGITQGADQGTRPGGSSRG
jgi:DNA-binding NarL/FixJ family response regulator